MLAGLVSMVVLGLRGEGVGAVWESALERGRIQLADWTTDPTQVREEKNISRSRK